MQYAGYAHLIHHDNISAIAPAISVEVRSVTRKETVGQTIAVPAKLAPAPDDRLGHVLFAIKHEGINLQVLAQALPAIPEPEIRQNAVISNVFSQAVSFRTEQNYLSNGLRGALGVTYVPPAPELSRSLMEQLMALANQPPEAVDPLVLASIVSFGFVFVHPFMDGNGRLSRFLFHQVLCQRGALQNGLVLPVSIVLRQNESEYLSVLQAFSEQARQYWDVTYIDENQFQFDFKGHEALYRYWDGTHCAEFMARATKQAIEQHLKEETIFLTRYDEIYRRIDQAFDIPNTDLSRLVMFCLDQNGRISNHRRKQYQYRVPEEIFDALERAYQSVVAAS